MKYCQTEYNFNNKKYNVFIKFGGVKNINYSIDDDGIHVSAPNVVTSKYILKTLDHFAPRLLKYYEVKNSHYNFKEDYVYLLGEKQSLKALNIVNNNELECFLKNTALQYLTNLTREYELKMGIEKPYKIRISKSSTRYGSNSIKTHTIMYQIRMIHYSPEIIKTLVVHELAHEFHRNHQQGFYDCVYLYCPDYDFFQNKLKKGIHK